MDDRTISSALAAAADAAPGWAVVRIDGQDVTAGWWDHEANRAARAFLALGLEPGDHVATLMSNRRGALVVWVALARAGIVEVPINTAMHGEMLDPMSGQTLKLRMVSRMISDDKEVFEYYMTPPGMPEMKQMEIVYVRKSGE